uniref:RH12280p n=1 Tax=Drosophila melanogaster TaxID=7227 RepID=Q5U1C0_DROME|nr:RH12280p [Drosophila melanogaster]
MEMNTKLKFGKLAGRLFGVLWLGGNLEYIRLIWCWRFCFAFAKPVSCCRLCWI